MPYKKQKAIRSNKKDVICDLMTELGLATSPNDRIDMKKGRCYALSANTGHNYVRNFVFLGLSHF